MRFVKLLFKSVSGIKLKQQGWYYQKITAHCGSNDAI